MTDSEVITVCPYCGRENEVATSVNTNVSPKNGDISICWGCSKPGVFDFDRPRNVRKPTLAEYIAIEGDPTMQKAMQVYQVACTPYEANRMMNE